MPQQILGMNYQQRFRVRDFFIRVVIHVWMLSEEKTLLQCI
jgi:hypothetical protein